MNTKLRHVAALALGLLASCAPVQPIQPAPIGRSAQISYAQNPCGATQDGIRSLLICYPTQVRPLLSKDDLHGKPN